jgi:mRNA interferase MazF
MPCSRNDVVLLPIPFTDLTSHKVRPDMVIGKGTFQGDLIVVPVTSRIFQSDLVLEDWSEAGLNVPSGVKGQIATVEDSFIRKVIGTLSQRDTRCLDEKLRLWLEL